MLLEQLLKPQRSYKHYSSRIDLHSAELVHALVEIVVGQAHDDFERNAHRHYKTVEEYIDTEKSILEERAFDWIDRKLRQEFRDEIEHRLGK